MLTLGILGSGSGSNMQAIVDAVGAGKLDARIAVVLSDQADARILDRARGMGIAAGVIDCEGYQSRFPEERQKEVAERLREAGVDLVCLAGFMRMVKEPLLEAFPGLILNIHPSLLPAFPGMRAWEQALAAGVAETGVTVHVVDAGMDTGPILKQEVVPVYGDDTADTLHARLQVVEHELYPEAIREYAAVLDL